MRTTIYFVAFFLLFSRQGFSQQFLTGKVFRKESTEALKSVSIHNLNVARFDLSDESGSYRVQVAGGDRLVFSSVGYKSDTVIVTPAMLTGDYPEYLQQKAVMLQSVQVGQLSNYQRDSVARREEYSWIYDHSGPDARVEKDRRGADGVGVSMNLFRHGSSKDKDRETLKKRLQKEENDNYIDYRYSKDYVSRLTHLQGDSLERFLREYRPSYDFCRKAATVDILVFINDSYKKFMKGEKPSGS